MKPYHYIVIVLVCLIASGCKIEPKKHRGRPGKETVSPPLVQHPPEPPDLYKTPPKVFTPRSRKPRQHYMPPQPNLATMPRLVTRFDACSVRATRKQRSISSIGALQGLGSGSGRRSAKKAKSSSGPRPHPPVAKDRAPARSKSRPDLKSAPSPTSTKGEGALASPRRSADRDGERSRAMERKTNRIADLLSSTKKMPKTEREAPAYEPQQLQEIAADDERRVAYEDWGSAIYLSNDDTMSLSSAQRVIYAIDSFLPLPLEHIRPHELLNYFAFETAAVDQGNDFSVLADLEADQRRNGIYSLSLSIKGRPLDKGSRRNTAITLVVDRSGSMREEGRMNYLKQGLRKMTKELKTGDMVHLVAFDHNVCVPLENFVMGRDPQNVLEQAINSITLGGSTDLHSGLSRGYEIADRTFRPTHSNRVMLITDALTNTGVTDAQLISMVSKYYDSRRIRLTGIGVGRQFNDALLDRLTERGKGAYVFLGSAAEVDAIFGARFVSLIETTANNVRFRLHLPPSLRMNVFYGEESSTVKEDVQQIHYFANTSQLFFSDLMARHGQLRPADWLMMTIEYEEPERGQPLVEEYAFNLSSIERESYNIKKARLIMAWVDLLALMAARPVVSGYRRTAGGWMDEEGWQRCDTGHTELNRLSRGVENDSEVKRVLDLWNKFCARFDRPRNPVRRPVVPRNTPRREAVRPSDSWPSAQPSNKAVIPKDFQL